MRTPLAIEMSFMEINAMGLSSLKYDEPVDVRELVALRALLTDIARDRDIPPETMQAIVAAQFGFDDIAKMGRNDVRKALEFLIDLHFDEIRSKK